MNVLGQIDGESLISLIIFGIIVVNAIVQMVRHFRKHKEEAEEIERPDAVRPTPQQPSASSPKNDLERLFEELSGRAEERERQRQRTISPPPQAPRPQVRIPSPATPIPAPAARIPAQPPPRAGTPAGYPRPVQKHVKPAPSEATIRKQAKIHRKTPPLELEVAPPMESAQTKGKKSEDLVARMLEQLPEKPLQRAIALREVFGPCRAKTGFRPGSW